MLNKIRSIKEAVFSGHERSVKIKKNIVKSMTFKLFNALVSFLLVPIILSYLGKMEFGLWVTLSSILGWFSFFDVGLGNGLRNKLSECIATKNFELARKYISTSYAILTLIFSSIILLVLCVFPFINWAELLNISDTFKGDLTLIVVVLAVLFLMKFIVQLISTIYFANQDPSKSDLVYFATNLITTVFVYLLTLVSNENLLYLTVVYSSIPVLTMLGATIIAFNTFYKHLKPSIRLVDFSYSKDLLGLGLKFFYVQIAAIILFSTDNIIITRLLGPEHVTPYEISFKYFMLSNMIFGVIVAPLWSSFSDAYFKDDMPWIKNAIKKSLKLWLLVVVGVITMLLCSEFAYSIWVGDKVEVPFELSVVMAIYVIASCFNMIFTNFLNGVGKMSLSLITATLTIILNIPLSVVFVKYCGFGLKGVMMATICCLSYSVLIRPYQTYLIVNKKAKGIWNK
jgi:O-antigen/teichoic acid export membrane protein